MQLAEFPELWTSVAMTRQSSLLPLSKLEVARSSIRLGILLYACSFSSLATSLLCYPTI